VRADKDGMQATVGAYVNGDEPSIRQIGEGGSRGYIVRDDYHRIAKESSPNCGHATATVLVRRMESNHGTTGVGRKGSGSDATRQIRPTAFPPA